MDEIYLDILEKFDNLDLDDDKPEDQLISECLKSSEIFSSPCEECTFYTDTDKKISFEDVSGLNVIRLQLAPHKRKAKNQKKQKPTHKIIGADLTEGYSDFQFQDPKNIYSLNGILNSVKYLINEKSYKLSDFKVVTLRRHLKKLMDIPIYKQPIQFYVVYWKGLIFLVYDWEMEPKISDNSVKLIQYAGFKFEDVLCEGNSQSRFYSVVKHSIDDDIPVLYSAEIDCAIVKQPGTSNYVELKTHTKLPNDKYATVNKLNKKLLSTYIQNKFVDCQHTVIGFRSDDLKLAAIKTYSESDIASSVNSLPIYSTPDSKITTKSIFLWYKLVMTWIARKKIDDNEKPKLFRLSFTREVILTDSNLSMEEIQNQEIIDNIIPEWFQTFINNK
ncbi:hypothetical protein G210_0897 [Candida maltosa Xu316]|uniref:Decapping nuclease n=1 Tax=Candida maltosa (strain Xu316) TaxID=1245528 RepID=M3J8V2_CANMX|nr:hypothetical protein G210_0897 [Candida maltosa Xu316]